MKVNIYKKITKQGNLNNPNKVIRFKDSWLYRAATKLSVLKNEI